MAPAHFPDSRAPPSPPCSFPPESPNRPVRCAGNPDALGRCQPASTALAATANRLDFVVLHQLYTSTCKSSSLATYCLGDIQFISWRRPWVLLYPSLTRPPPAWPAAAGSCSSSAGLTLSDACTTQTTSGTTVPPSPQSHAVSLLSLSLSLPLPHPLFTSLVTTSLPHSPKTPSRPHTSFFQRLSSRWPLRLLVVAFSDAVPYITAFLFSYSFLCSYICFFAFHSSHPLIARLCPSSCLAATVHNSIRLPFCILRSLPHPPRTCVSHYQTSAVPFITFRGEHQTTASCPRIYPKRPFHAPPPRDYPRLNYHPTATHSHLVPFATSTLLLTRTKPVTGPSQRS